jgi:hypothetical protein
MKAGALETEISCFYYMYRFVGIILQISDNKFMDLSDFLQSSCHYLDSRGTEGDGGA